MNQKNNTPVRIIVDEFKRSVWLRCDYMCLDVYGIVLCENQKLPSNTKSTSSEGKVVVLLWFGAQDQGE